MPLDPFAPATDAGSMRWLVAVLLVVTSGCDGSRAVGVGDGGVLDTGGPCSCAEQKSTLAGTVNGQAITFDRTYYGITVTWGTHASPVSPAEAVDLSLLLTDHQVSCSGANDFPVDVGPLLRVRIMVGTSQQVDGDWIPSKEGWTSVEGELCLRSVPLKEHEPLGLTPTVSGSVPGCASLRFTRGGKPAGQASGSFAALRCPSMDSAFGE